MPSTTTTVAFRVAKSVEEQIRQLAQASGQSKGDWVRDQVMKALHDVEPTMACQPQDGPPMNGPKEDLMRIFEVWLQKTEGSLRDEIRAVRTAISEVAKSHHRDLCTLGQIGLDAQQSVEREISSSCDDTLDAIERLKQSQRSHKESVLEVIANSDGRKNKLPPRP